MKSFIVICGSNRVETENTKKNAKSEDRQYLQTSLLNNSEMKSSKFIMLFFHLPAVPAEFHKYQTKFSSFPSSI